MGDEPLKILFVCSRNQWRSPTAEQIYSRHPRVHARSAGTASSARRQVTLADIQWADAIIVMEDKHLARLWADFPAPMKFKECHVLDIPDAYRYVDPDLIAELRAAVDPLFDTFL